MFLRKQGTGPIAGYQQFNDTYGPKAKVADFLKEPKTQPISNSGELPKVAQKRQK